MTFKRV